MARSAGALSLFFSLAAFGAILCAVTLAGASPARPLFPPGSAWRPERWGWSFALGCALVAIETAAAVRLGLSPGWLSFLAAATVAAAAAPFFRLPVIGRDVAPERMRPAVRGLLLLLLVSGVALYLLRALTEPMWSNDYLAIWGLKGKTIALARAFPPRVLPAGLYGFSHPEYPLGLPLLYAGLASMLGRWDDHGLALLFPFIQVATLLVLFGWLRRHGVARPIPLAAAALLSQWEPLYSGFLTGLAEVPLSSAFLLFGTAFSDSLEETDPGARRRLALASLLAAATKNEGLFLAVAGGAGALFARAPKRGRVAAAALLPAAAVAAITRVASGGAGLRDLDFGFLGPRMPELPGRLAETLRAALLEVALSAWPLLLCLALLLVAGRSSPFGNRLLWLPAACLAAYLLLPPFASRGPAWLVRTTLARTTAALAPLVVAGVAARLSFAEGGRRKARSPAE